MDEGQDNKTPMIPETSLKDLQAQATKPYTVCVIPCKVSSARLPGKNFMEVDDYPMMMWAVMKAMCCPQIDLVCISTDNRDLLMEKVPNLKAKMFDEIVLAQRGPDFLHPDTPIYNLIMEAIQALAVNEALERPPTHVVMMQPNVPTIPQVVINSLVFAVVVENFNVARHYYTTVVRGTESNRLGGVMTGGCDAYKIAALTSPVAMDSYNYAIITADPEVHEQESLELVNEIIKDRKREASQGKSDEEAWHEAVESFLNDLGDESDANLVGPLVWEVEGELDEDLDGPCPYQLREGKRLRDDYAVECTVTDGPCTRDGYEVDECPNRCPDCGNHPPHNIKDIGHEAAADWDHQIILTCKKCLNTWFQHSLDRDVADCGQRLDGSIEECIKDECDHWDGGNCPHLTQQVRKREEE